MIKWSGVWPAVGQVSIVQGCLEVAGLTLSTSPQRSAWPPTTPWQLRPASASLTTSSPPAPPSQPASVPLANTHRSTAVPLSPLSPGGSLQCNVARLLLMMETNTCLPASLNMCVPVIICLARLSQFTFLSRAPPLAFSLGWEPQLRLETGGQLSENLSQELLQEVDILQQFI